MENSLSNDFPGEEQSKLPSGLNVLTILTIIGSILGLISGIWGYFSAEKNYNKTKEFLDSNKMDDAPAFVKKMMTPEMLEMQHKALLNRLPIMILTLVASALCLYGALEMRKRKKQGYIFWLIGEILPLIATALFLGASTLTGTFGIIAIFIALLFIILYTVNRKDLIY